MSGAKLPTAPPKPTLRKRIAAWRYRIPMPVTQVLQVSDTSYPICPRCDCTVDREYMNFCDRCGQKLGWKLLDFAEQIPAPRTKRKTDNI